MKRDRFLSGEIRMFLKNAVNNFCEYLTKETEDLQKSFLGKALRYFILIGPLTFIPTLWVAYTAENIDALRTTTWPLMLIVNIGALLSLAKEGDWVMRFVGIMWVIVVLLVLIAIWIR